jgi:hypothetical protein
MYDYKTKIFIFFNYLGIIDLFIFNIIAPIKNGTTQIVEKINYQAKRNACQVSFQLINMNPMCFP